MRPKLFQKFWQMTWAKSRIRKSTAFEAYQNIARFCLPFVAPKSRNEAFLSITCVLCIIAAKVFHLVDGLFIKLAVDALSSDDATVRVSGPIQAAALYLGGRAIVCASTYVYLTAQESYTTRVMHRLALYAFRTLMDQSVEFHETRRLGETSHIVWSGVEAVNTIIRHLMFWFLPTALEAIYMAIIFCGLGTPLVALLALITVATHTWYTAKQATRRFALANRRTQTDSASKAYLTERLAEHAAITAFGVTVKEVEKFDLLQYESRKAVCTEKHISTLGEVSADLIIRFGVFFCFLAVAAQASTGHLSVGEFTLIVSYIAGLFYPLLRLAGSFGEVVNALPNAEKFVNLIEASNAIQDSLYAKPLPSPELDVPFLEYRDVSFSHKDADGVKSISLKVRGGQMVGIVGPSGAGKSTLVKLALRLYDIKNGNVLVHGADVRTLNRDSVRQGIALVSQETAVFNATVRDNIKLGVPDATDSAVMHALQLANLDTFVKGLPEQLNTMVGERGVRLSGGERQRLGIARAFLKNSNILLLDEATSSLSALDEKEVVESITENIHSRGVLVVAHRLSTVRDAAEIIVMNSGRIEERGTHQELINSGGLYSEMWRLQTGGNVS